MIEGPIQEAYLRAVYIPCHKGKPLAFSFTRHAGYAPMTLAIPSPWVIITPHNPMSLPMSERGNTRRTAEFMEFLHARRLASEPSESRAPDGSWAEAGRILFGITREGAIDIARRFEQRAVVWSERDRVGILDCRTERWTIRTTLGHPDHR